MLPLTVDAAAGPRTQHRRSSGGVSTGADGLLSWAMRGGRAQPDSPDSDPGRAPKTAGPSTDQLQVCAIASPAGRPAVLPHTAKSLS